MSGGDVGYRCRAATSGVRPGVRQMSMSGSPAEVGSWCFRYGLATQDLVSHDVHGLRTAIATGNALFLLFLSEAEDVGV